MPARVSIEDYKNGTAQHAKVQVLSLYLHRQLDDTTWIVKDSQDVTKLNISNPKHAMNLKAGSYIKLVNAVRFCIWLNEVLAFSTWFTLQVFDGKDFTTKNAPLSAQPFGHKKTASDDEGEGASAPGASYLKSFEDVEKLPPQAVVPSLKAKIVNLSPKKPVRGGSSYLRIAGLQDIKGKRNAVNLFGEAGDKVEAGKVCNQIILRILLS